MTDQGKGRNPDHAAPKLSDGDSVTPEDVHSMLYPPLSGWKRALYNTFFAGFLAAGAGMMWHSAGQVARTSQLEGELDGIVRRRDTLRLELDAIRYQAGVVEEDGMLISRLPLEYSNLEVLADYCERPPVTLDTHASTRRIYQSVVEIDIRGHNGLPGGGSGVLLTENGYVVTAHHVVADFVGGVVRMHNGREYQIMHPILISSPEHDIAIIKVDREGQAQTMLYNRDFQAPSAGTDVFIFGFYEGIPFNQMGRITQVGHDAVYDDLDVQNTALVSAYTRPGFSGGAVVRADDGALIGITTYATFNEGGGIGYPSGFVPLFHAREVLQAYLCRQAGTSGNSCF